MCSPIRHPHFSSFLYTFAIHQLLFFLFNVQSNRWIHEVASCHGLSDLIPTNETNVRKYRTLPKPKLLFFLFWGESLARVLGTALQDINCWAEQTAFWTRESLVAEVLPPQRLGRTWASTKTLRPVATWWVLEASKVNMKLASWVGGELDEEKFHARGGEIRCLFFFGNKGLSGPEVFFIPRLKWLRPRMYDPVWLYVFSFLGFSPRMSTWPFLHIC